MNKCRKLKLMKNYVPCKAVENEEIFRNGIFNFNISRILEDIIKRELDVEREDINTADWYRIHFHGLIDETHLLSVDITKPVIQAEIIPGRYEIIDGNHRLEKAYRNNIETVNSYKLRRATC
ncbi:ParB N-terminal domain-containing protein [Natronincola ferrireducens]|uniref:ParB-like nuclease domain-containing protein n=1 Tax=Natronincola ferrireducens TaxID=393762 RepID=A0A1G9IJD6_9FIRM|nr:ParB N-terminal domain-containing protein [Natronincola ferrireducens]SDL25290.1 ParB-like nuclease domain-containing protein [Natronincola ferrireducens]